MFTYIDIIAMAIGGILLLGFIIAIKGKIDAGWLGVAWLSTISLIFFAPAIMYGLNFPATAHEITNLVKLCPETLDRIDGGLPAPLSYRNMIMLYNECKP
jgi:hypothetical protein